MYASSKIRCRNIKTSWLRRMLLRMGAGSVFLLSNRSCPMHGLRWNELLHSVQTTTIFLIVFVQLFPFTKQICNIVSRRKTRIVRSCWLICCCRKTSSASLGKTCRPGLTGIRYLSTVRCHMPVPLIVSASGSSFSRRILYFNCR